MFGEGVVGQGRTEWRQHMTVGVDRNCVLDGEVNETFARPRLLIYRVREADSRVVTALSS